MVRFRLRYQRENGLMNRAKRRWFPKKPICEGGVRGFTTVGIAEVKPALLLLLMGMGASFGVLFVEWLVKIISDQRKKKRSRRNGKTKIKFCN